MLRIANASTQERATIWPNLGPIQNALLQENASWLRSKLKDHNLFDQRLRGIAVSKASWLIVQHADHDPEWQAEVLARVTKLANVGAFDQQKRALLQDRVLVNFGKPQRFGTQGKCGEDGKWHPREIENAEDVDARRAAIDLAPMSKYVERFKCS